MGWLAMGVLNHSRPKAYIGLLVILIRETFQREVRDGDYSPEAYVQSCRFDFFSKAE